MLRKQLQILSARDTQIMFREKGHQYMVADRVVPQSVTSCVSQMFPPFNMARKSAYTRSIFNTRTLVGTIAHALVHAELSGQPLAPQHILDENMLCNANAGLYNNYHDERMTKRELATFYQKFKYTELLREAYDILSMWKILRKDFLSRPDYTLIASEFMVWTDYNQDDLLAGSIDALYWLGSPERREVVIIDWKTAKEIFDAEKEIDIQTSPFFGMKCNKFSKYSCQLHTYAQILERHYDVRVVQIYVAQIRRNMYSLVRVSHPSECRCKIYVDVLD